MKDELLINLGYPTVASLENELVSAFYDSSVIAQQIQAQRDNGAAEPLAIMIDFEHILASTESAFITLPIIEAFKDWDIPVITFAHESAAAARLEMEESAVPPVQAYVGYDGLEILVQQSQNRTNYVADTHFTSLVASHSEWNKDLFIMRAIRMIHKYPGLELQIQQPVKDSGSELDGYHLGLNFTAGDTGIGELSGIVAELFPGVLASIYGPDEETLSAKHRLDLSAMDRLGAALYLKRLLDFDSVVAGGSGSDARLLTLNPGLLSVAVGGCEQVLMGNLRPFLDLNNAEAGKITEISGDTGPKLFYLENDPDRTGTQSLVHALMEFVNSQKEEYMPGLRSDLSAIIS